MSAPTTPIAIPITPPISEISIASARNCFCTSPGPAPTAMRSPISRIRSVTETSMMFMMPMPPMIRQMPATAPSSLDIRLVVAVRVATIWLMLRTAKSSSAPGSILWRWRSSASISLCALARFLASSTPTEICCTAPGGIDCEFDNRRRAVSSGTTTMSSWSWPKPPCPFAPSTPTTVNGTRPRRTVWPIGSSSPNRVLRTVSPRITGLALPP